jgi:hypothetical protein
VQGRGNDGITYLRRRCCFRRGWLRLRGRLVSWCGGLLGVKSCAFHASTGRGACGFSLTLALLLSMGGVPSVVRLNVKGYSVPKPKGTICNEQLLIHSIPNLRR